MVDINKLMLGDILLAVYDDGETVKKFPVRVDGLDKNSTLVDGTCEISWVPVHEEDRYEERADELLPVNLTPEILEKNKWIFMEGADYSTFPVPSKWTYQFVPFVLTVCGEKYRIANTFTITYVHELQNFLRYAGHDELADSFEV